MVNYSYHFENTYQVFSKESKTNIVLRALLIVGAMIGSRSEEIDTKEALKIQNDKRSLKRNRLSMKTTLLQKSTTHTQCF